jgi:RecB family exonuclease
VSPSKIEQFADCGLRWLLSNRGAEGPPVGSAQVGTLVHEIAAAFPDEATTDERLEALDRSWHRLGLAPGWVERQQRRLTEQMVARIGGYLQAANADGWRRAGAEARMRVVLGRAVVQGSVDRVEVHPERGYRVVDLKTGSSRPTNAQVSAHPQLGAYQLAVERGAIDGLPEGQRRSAGAALLQVGKAWTQSGSLQAQVPLAEAEDPTWVERLVEETADGMSASTFTASPEASRCRVCPVRMCCPAHAEGGRL